MIVTIRAAIILATALTILLAANPLLAAGGSLKPSVKDKCPVCGMLVSKYPNWLCSVLFRDGGRVFFDGPKDLFTYLTNLNHYAPDRNSVTIVAMQVKDYYSLLPIDARSAYYVSGGDVFGPMGKELVPFGNAAAAQEFMKDHKGKKVLRFAEINRQVLKSLE